MIKYLIIFILGILILGGGYLFLQKNSSKKDSSKAIEKLTIATVDTPSFGLMHIAQNKGYFREEELEVVYKKFPKGIDALNDALSGNSDLGLSFETPAVRKIYEGEKLLIISSLHSSTKNTAIVARKDKRILSFSDLKGKKIGVTKTSSYEFFLYSSLLSQGVKLSDVTIVDGELRSLGMMLKEGKVDAVAIGNPFLFDVKKEFSPELLSIFQSEVYTENSIVAGREDIVKNKKEAITRFLRALAKAENLYKTNNSEALNAIIAELPDFSEDTIRGTWGEYTLGLKLDNVLLTVLGREGQWFKDNGIYKTEVPNFRSALFDDYLKSVKPDAVTLY